MGPPSFNQLAGQSAYMSHTIHTFRELKDLGKKRVEFRYDKAEVARANQGDVECDDQSEIQNAPCDNLGLEPSNTEEVSFPPEPVILAPGALGAHGTATQAEFAELLDSNLSAADFAKLVEHGVRPKDAFQAGLCRVSSSEGAFRLDRVDTGAFAGILTSYRLDGGIFHCRIMFDKPVTLAGKNKGRLVSILQPTRSTNHLYVLATTEELLASPKVAVLICADEWSALAAVQICEQENGTLSMVPVGFGGPWGWRMSVAVEDRDGGETKIQKGPVIGLKEKVALEGRRIIVAYGSGADNDADITAARAALIKLLQKQRAVLSVLEVPARTG